MTLEARFTLKLARHVTDASFDSLSEETGRQVKRAVLDRLGCALGAMRLGIGEGLINWMSGTCRSRGASIWGVDGMFSPIQAALANGAVSSHLEYDSHDPIPAAVSVAESLQSSGRELMVALAAGYRVGGAVSRLLAPEVERRGLHWPAHLSAFSSTAACCRILNLDEERTAAALGLAGCLSPISPFEAFTQGASVKDLYGGWGNMLGVMAAQLSLEGFSGPDTLFEGERGIGRIWLGTPPTNEELEDVLKREERGDLHLGIKPYPCCTAAHPALSAIEKLLAGKDIDPSSISSVRIETYAFGASLSGASEPDTPISAKVNIPFLAATMLTYGNLLPEHTEPPYLDEPGIRRLMRRIRVCTLPDTDKPLQERRRPATVIIRLFDGPELEASVDEPKWSRIKPATDGEVQEKFRTLVGDFIPVAQSEELRRFVYNLEEVHNIREVINMMLPA